ncbi:uncharacterized protein LOC105692460 isoform X3 [Athalia rosae]|uniref:uncharacterized protein LOC105692460 isoform X3 n=1 Tax=Athalia rosae TaxID=37344 RepID=UPI00203431B3|nr:uncharacterized protein LOC105692460 isoform X3 [Athalia rosae]
MAPPLFVMRKEEQWRHGAHRIICTSASRHFRNPLQRYLRNHMIPPDRECFADQYRESTSCGGAFLLPLTLLLLLLLLYRRQTGSPHGSVVQRQLSITILGASTCQSQHLVK